jgi:hypothetical protein
MSDGNHRLRDARDTYDGREEDVRGDGRNRDALHARECLASVGISWTDEEFIRAVREGVRKDGAHLYPAFPYTSYTELSRNDATRIAAHGNHHCSLGQPHRS